jgi:hypothetical protein
MALLDAYERKARLTPGLIAFAPVAFLIATLGLKRYPSVAVGVAVLSAAGGTYALSVLVASFGRRAQVHLWRAWQGPPTTRFLRTREAVENPIQRNAWREAVEKVTGITLLSASQESLDQTAADNTIVTAVGQIKRLGQDARFPLVKEENIQYGFERNLFGFRWMGRLISLACVTALAAVLFLSESGSGFSKSALVSGIIVDAIFFIVWILVPSTRRTREAGERYAQQLFQAVVSISHGVGDQGGTNSGVTL